MLSGRTQRRAFASTPEQRNGNINCNCTGIRRYHRAGGREVLGQLDVGGQDGRGGRGAGDGVRRSVRRHAPPRRRRRRRQGLAVHVRQRGGHAGFV